VGEAVATLEVDLVVGLEDREEGPGGVDARRLEAIDLVLAGLHALCRLVRGHGRGQRVLDRRRNGRRRRATVVVVDFDLELEPELDLAPGLDPSCTPPA